MYVDTESYPTTLQYQLFREYSASCYNKTNLLEMHNYQDSILKKKQPTNVHSLSIQLITQLHV